MSEQDLPTRINQTLATLDSERDRIIDGLHDATGNHGGVHEHFEPLLETLADTLYASKSALEKKAREQELTRPERKSLRQAEKITAVCEALILLSGVTSD
ncbi:MAG: hypothetical protein VYE40_05685 [Myxococcota bacterium]|jgi:hypothetical protein|nr:hypothetical protein [Myxococcota bacterium]MEC9440566.1 hypothetical protein [Myxococcota bacterium]